MMKVMPIQHERRYPPRVTEFTAPFWRGLLKGDFSTTRCQACQRLSFPPKPICPHCWGGDVAWETLPNTGCLYSWTRIHAGPAVFEPDLPYEVGIVDMDAGIRVASPLYGESIPWRCDMRVEMVTLSFVDGPFFAAAPA